MTTRRAFIAATLSAALTSAAAWGAVLVPRHRNADGRAPADRASGDPAEELFGERESPQPGRGARGSDLKRYTTRAAFAQSVPAPGP